jgi:hypothetical protein
MRNVYTVQVILFSSIFSSCSSTATDPLEHAPRRNILQSVTTTTSISHDESINIEPTEFVSYLRKKSSSKTADIKTSIQRSLNGSKGYKPSSSGKSSKSTAHKGSKSENHGSKFDSSSSSGSIDEAGIETTVEDVEIQHGGEDYNVNDADSNESTIIDGRDENVSESDISSNGASSAPSGKTEDSSTANTESSGHVVPPPPIEAADESSSTTTVRHRTVQLSHPQMSNECMAYSTFFSQAKVQMMDCTVSTDGSIEPDHWELVIDDSSMNDDSNTTTPLFFLRHKMTQLCIPKNPENPDQPFDCFRYSGEGEAIADSINGLVDCDNGFAAKMAQDDSTGSLYLYNTDCINEIEPGDEMDVIFMSYHRGHQSNGTQIVMWGEKIILNMTDLVEQHNFQSEWKFVVV